MTGHRWQTTFAEAMRRRRWAPRSPGGWKNAVVSMPWHAAWLCQTQFSIMGGSGKAGVLVVGASLMVRTLFTNG